MDTTQVAVTLSGAAAIALVLWFFFFSTRKRTAAEPALCEAAVPSADSR